VERQVTINGGCEQDMSVFRDAEKGQEMTNSRSEKSQPRTGYRSPHQLIAAFGRASQASSASFFSQADMPLAPAFRLYDAFSAAVQRKCTCLVPLSLAGKGGLPLRLAFMAGIMVYTESSCNPSLGMI
jgi:hypothetical protein